MLWLFFALKIPLLTLCWIVWWAIKQEPEVDEHRDDGGIKRRRHPVPKLPRAPRRGPHGGQAMASPPRVRRPVHARARSVSSR
jgi:hypothetical protein